MLPLRVPITLCLLAVFASSQAGLPAVQAGPRLDQLLPATTCAFYHSPKPQQLRVHFKTTQFYQLLQDKNLKPFLDNLEAQFDNQGGALELLGFTVNDMVDLAGGEAGYAIVAAANGEAAHVFLTDTTGKGEVLKKVLAARSKRWKDAKGEEREETAGEFTLTVQSRAATANSKAQLRVHALKGDLFVVANDVAALRGLLQRGVNAPDSLAAARVYQAVRAQTTARDKEEPQLYFFLDPWKLVALERPSTAATKKRDPIDMLRKQGFDAVKGVGGWLAFDHDGFDVYYRSAVQAPGPFQLGMRMLKTLPGTDFKPERWARPPFSGYSTLHIDLLNAHDSFDAVFDMVVNNGVPGAWQDSLKALKEDPDGPRLDFRKDIMAQLCDRISCFTDNAESITRNGDRFLVGVQAKNAAALQEAVERFMGDDPRVKRRAFQGHTIFEFVAKPPKKKPGRPEAAPPPNSALAVADGFLFLSSQVEFIETVLRKDGGMSIATLKEYELFQKAVARQDGSQAVGQQFHHLANNLKVSFELARLGRLQGAGSLDAGFYRMLAENLKAIGVDVHYDKLPPFEKIARHLTYNGSLIRNTSAGWEMTGFVLKKSAQ
jgi:hypothetical protein